MSRSPLTLAAAATAAVPDSVVVSARAFGGDGERHYDSALVVRRGGDTVLVRAATDDESDRALRDELRILDVLTAGIRSLLPFRAPQVHGRTELDGRAVGVVDFLPGYRVPTAELMPGTVAADIGRAIAAVHDLPVTVARDAGLVMRSAELVRTELTRLIDRAAATGHVDRGLLARWRAALDDDALWQFEPSVVLGGTNADCFLFTDDEQGPHLRGVLGWEGLSAGDPATDLAWIAQAPDASASVVAAYLAASARAADPLLTERARLYAELDFAEWLLQGVDADDDAVVQDAVAMLATLADTTRGTDLLPRTGGDVAAAVELLDRIPAPAASPADTSMQTDAYDPSELAAYLSDPPEPTAAEGETAPIDLSEWHTEDESISRG